MFKKIEQTLPNVKNKCLVIKNLLVKQKPIKGFTALHFQHVKCI